MQVPQQKWSCKEIMVMAESHPIFPGDQYYYCKSNANQCALSLLHMCIFIHEASQAKSGIWEYVTKYHCCLIYCFRKISLKRYI